MKNAKLILIEGLPGSGKSTTAHHLSRFLTNSDIDNKWWYEEEKNHPVYIYKDQEEAQYIIKDLSDGKYNTIINKALEQWRNFGSYLESTNKIVLIDSCFFGYLSWSLFPFDVPKDVIKEYTLAVEKIIKPFNPCLVYLYQDDVNQALKKICNRREGNMENHLIQAATESPYGKNRYLTGFEGMVKYWEDYRSITDDIFNMLEISKLAIENSEGKYDNYFSRILDHLDLDSHPVKKVLNQELEEFVGTYYSKDSSSVCNIENYKDYLIIDGLPYVWKKTKLLPVSSSVFETESLPLTVTFVKNCSSDKLFIIITGPKLYNRSKNEIYEKETP